MDESRETVARANLKRRVEEFERSIIEDALRLANGNQRQAARELGVLPTTLHEKMKRLGLLRRESTREPVALAG